MVKKSEDGEVSEESWAALGIDITEAMRKAEQKVETDMQALTDMLKKEYDRGVKDGIIKGQQMMQSWYWTRAKAEGLIDPSEVD